MRVVSLARALGSDERRQKVAFYLRRRCEVVDVGVRLPLAQRIVNLSRTTSPRRDVWRERSKKNPYFFTQVSRAVRREIARRAGDWDVVLMFEALFSPGLAESRLWPYAIYEDSTSMMAMAQWPEWVPDSARSDAYLALEQQHYRNAALIFTTNDATRRSLISDYAVSEERILTVGQGHDFAEVAGEGRRPEPATILFVGYDFERKGGPALLDAFRIIRQYIPDAVLLLAGPKMSLREPGVSVLGPVGSKRQLEMLYRGATAFVLPSIFDPMPHAVLEAMSFEVPVVVSTGCGSVELIEDGVNGLIVPVNDADTLAARLLRLLRDEPLQRSIGAAGAATVREKCSWPAIADVIAANLEHVIDTNHRRRAS